MTKRTRKIKPYPQIAPDEDLAMPQVKSDLPDVLLGAAMTMAFVIFLFLFGIAGYVWGLTL